MANERREKKHSVVNGGYITSNGLQHVRRHTLATKRNEMKRQKEVEEKIASLSACWWASWWDFGAYTPSIRAVFSPLCPHFWFSLWSITIPWLWNWNIKMERKCHRECWGIPVLICVMLPPPLWTEPKFHYVPNDTDNASSDSRRIIK